MRRAIAIDPADSAIAASMSEGEIAAVAMAQEPGRRCAALLRLPLMMQPPPVAAEEHHMRLYRFAEVCLDERRRCCLDAAVLRVTDIELLACDHDMHGLYQMRLDPST